MCGALGFATLEVAFANMLRRGLTLIRLCGVQRNLQMEVVVVCLQRSAAILSP